MVEQKLHCHIRHATERDVATIGSLLDQAFDGTAERVLVERLRRDPAFVGEFVALVDDRVVGAILFSRLDSTIDQKRLSLAALAPLVVDPAVQRQGIGSQLVRESLEWIAGEEFDGVIVLGDPLYYGRFGFRANLITHFESPYHGEAFMGLEFSSGVLAGRRGEIAYPSPFASLEESDEHGS